MDGSCFYLRPPFGRLTRWRQNSRAKQFVVVVVGAQHNSSGSSSSITVQQQPQGRNKQINMNIKPGELSILQLFLTASIIIIIIIKFQTTSASNSLPNGATCVLKPSDLQSQVSIDNDDGAFTQISPNSAQIITKNSNIPQTERALNNNNNNNKAFDSSHTSNNKHTNHHQLNNERVVYQKVFDSICNWTTNIDRKSTKPAAYWVLDFKRTALVAKFAYYEKSDFTDLSMHEARLTSPVFDPIPAYHSMHDSSYKGSCRIRFKSYITIPAHLDLHLIVSPTHDDQYNNQLAPLGSTTSNRQKNYLIIKLWEGKNPRAKQLAADQGETAAWIYNDIALPYNVTYPYYLEFSTMPAAVTSAAAHQHSYLNGVAIANISLSPQCFGFDVDKQELERIKILMVRKDSTKFDFIERNITFVVVIFMLIVVLFIKFILCSYLPQHKHYVVGPRKQSAINNNNNNNNNNSELLDNNQRGLSPLGNILDCELVENPNYYVINSSESDSCRLDGFKIDRKCLTLTKPLGKGAFGEVYKGYLICSDSSSSTDGGDYSTVLVETDDTNNDAHSIEVAVKTLTDERMSEKDFLIEATNMSMVRHRNIVQFFGVCFEEKPLYIVMEYLPGGNLKNFLIKNRGIEPQVKLCMGDLLVYALDISRACTYLQEHLFIHRDLATRNCLLTASQKALASSLECLQFALTENNNNNNNTQHLTADELYLNGYKNSSIVAKLSDFGLTRDVTFADYYRVGHKEMPVRWMAPECLDGVATTKSDVWSFGVFLWELFSMGQQPYNDLRENRQVVEFINSRRFVVKPPPPSPPVVSSSICETTIELPPPLPKPHINSPQAIYKIMCSCWASNPQDRPQFNDIAESLIKCLQMDDVLNESLPCISS